MTPASDIRRVLVVCLDNIGDAVMGTAVIPMLRAAYPGVEIGFWVKEYAAGLFERDGLVERVFASDPFWDKSPGHGSGSWARFWATVAEIRAARYDAALILNAEWRRAFAVWRTGIPVRVGYARRKSSPFLTRAVRWNRPAGHVCEEHAALVNAWTLAAPELAVPRLLTTEDDRRWAASWVDWLGWNGHPLVVLHPFAGNPARMWPWDSWVEFIRALQRRESSLRFAVIAGREEGRSLQEEIREIFPTSVRVVPGVTLGQLKALTLRAALYAGADSGPGHVAAALDVPMVSLFGVTDPGRFGPRGRGEKRVIRYDPISALPVDLVEREAWRLLEPAIKVRA